MIYINPIRVETGGREGWGGIPPFPSPPTPDQSGNQSPLAWQFATSNPAVHLLSLSPELHPALAGWLVRHPEHSVLRYIFLSTQLIYNSLSSAMQELSSAETWISNQIWVQVFLSTFSYCEPYCLIMTPQSTKTGNLNYILMSSVQKRRYSLGKLHLTLCNINM